MKETVSVMLYSCSIAEDLQWTLWARKLSLSNPLMAHP